MSWQEITLKRFEDFVGHLHDLMPSTSTANQLYWFRGQRDRSWPLEPSLTRCVHALKLSHQATQEIEPEALKAFQSQAHLFVPPPLLAKVFTKPCWWALMQHHGAPTRLLDWSASPYVAAYFAVQHNETQAPGAIWAFCSNMLRKDIEAKAIKAQIGLPPEFDSASAASWYDKALATWQGEEIVMPLTFRYVTSERIVAQQGRFTMCFRVNSGHDSPIEQVLPQYVRKFLIPHELKPEFLLRLREMNIAGSALFPGIDGLGQSVREFVDLRARYSISVASGDGVACRSVDTQSVDAPIPPLESRF